MEKSGVLFSCPFYINTLALLAREGETDAEKLAAGVDANAIFLGDPHQFAADLSADVTLRV